MSILKGGWLDGFPLLNQCLHLPSILNTKGVTTSFFKVLSVTQARTDSGRIAPAADTLSAVLSGWVNNGEADLPHRIYKTSGPTFTKLTVMLLSIIFPHSYKTDTRVLWAPKLPESYKKKTHLQSFVKLGP